MPIVIFRERGEALYAYIAKQDLEARCSRSNMTRRTAGAARLPSKGDVATTSIRSRGDPSSR